MADNALLPFRELRTWCDDGRLCRATLVGEHLGYLVVVRGGGEDRILATGAGSPRRFATLAAAAGVLRRLGIVTFRVDHSGGSPNTAGAARSDPRVAARQGDAPAPHDTWFRQQVAAALAKADTTWHRHADVFAELEAD